MYYCNNCTYTYYSYFEHSVLGRVCPVCLQPVLSKSQRRRNRRRRAAIRRKDCALEVIAKRDNYICQLCGEPVDMKVTRGKMRPSRDHIIPPSQGGLSVPENLQLAHQNCNSVKGNKMTLSPSTI